MKRVITVFLITSIYFQSTIAQGTLDEDAYNLAWNKYVNAIEDTFEADTSYLVHVLDIPIPINASDPESSAPYREYVNLVSTIPAKHFTINPEIISEEDKLHNIYGEILRSVKLRTSNTADQERLQKLSNIYADANTEYVNNIRQLNLSWLEEKELKEKLGQNITQDDYANFLALNGASLAGVRSKLISIYREIQSIETPDDFLLSTFQQYHSANLGRSMANPTIPYNRNISTLQRMDTKCEDDGPWKFFLLDNKLKETTRIRKSWNGGGKWRYGGFFKIKGGASGNSYKEVINKDDEYIKVSFCDLKAIPASPSDLWFNMRFLERVHRGDYDFKEGFEIEEAVLGENGLIPRTIRGFIVASQIKIEGKLDQSYYEEFKSNTNLSGGTRIGWLKIKGGSNKKEYKEIDKKKTGEFGYKTNSSDPVILAVITRETKG